MGEAGKARVEIIGKRGADEGWVEGMRWWKKRNLIRKQRNRDVR